MTRQRLAQLSLEDLTHLADIFDVDLDDFDSSNRASIEEAVFEAIEESRDEQADEDTFPVAYQQRRYEEIDDLFGRPIEIEEQGFSFPEMYNVTRIELLLRDPAWAYSYWDLSVSDKARCARAEDFLYFALRLSEQNPTKKTEDLHVNDIPIKLTDSNWYVNLPVRDTRYLIELLAFYESGEEVLASSQIIKVPTGGISSRIEIVDSFEVDALIALSGIEKLGTAEMPQIPQRILSALEGRDE